MTTVDTPPLRVVARLMSKMEKRSDGCWISLYSAGSHGYSQIGWNTNGERRLSLGHRASWVAFNGPIPDGMTIDHICRTRKCINPEHLRLLPNIENARGGGGMHMASIPKPTGRKCATGLHELLEYPTGAVACRECQQVRARRKYPNRTSTRASKPKEIQ